MTNEFQSEPRMAPSPADRPFEPLDYGLYAATVVIWSTSWFAMTLQLGTVPNEVNAVWRFGIATTLLFGWVIIRRQTLWFRAADHARFAALGVLLFSTNLLCFYYGALYLVSGLLSVVFSLASVVTLFLAALVMRERPTRRLLIGGLLGTCGVALMFYPEIAAHGLSGDTLIGLGFCAAGTTSFCVGSLVSASAQRRGIPLIPMNAWGMLYGTIWSAFLALMLGKPFIVEPTVSYLASLLFLAVISTTFAFAAYLTLLGRIGGARAAYATVAMPVFALIVSTFLEGYAWTPYALAGLVLVAFGNVIVIRGAKPQPISPELRAP